MDEILRYDHLNETSKGTTYTRYCLLFFNILQNKILLAKKLHCNKYTNRYDHMIGVGQMRIEIKVTRRQVFSLITSGGDK